MTITRVQITQGGVADGAVGSPVQTADFPAPCIAGNIIIAIIRSNGAAALTSIADTLMSDWIPVVSDTGHDPYMYIYYAVCGAGTNKIGANFSSEIGYPWVFGIEVSGLDAGDPIDETDGKEGTGVTDLVSNALDTTDNNEYVVCGAAQANFCSYTAGADFTLVDGTIPSLGSDFGGVQEWIIAAALSSYVAHMTSTVSNQYTLVTATFREMAAEAGVVISPIFLENNIGFNSFKECNL